MSVLYGSLNVDEKYSSILEPNLYHDIVMVDGKTFTSKYEEGPAGGIFVHKLGTSAVAVGTPGRDFTDEATADSLIPIVMNNNYQKSKKIYGVQANAVAIDLANEQLGTATKEVAEGVQQSALACLVKEGTASSDTVAVSSSNIKTKILADRKAIREAKGKADVILMTPEVYAFALEKFGSEFTPVANDYVNANGQIANWLGFAVYECSGLGEASAKYYDNAGTQQTVSFAKVEYVMYNHEALSLIPNFDVARIVDSENFNGSKAQVEMNVGLKVTSAAQVIVKSHA